MTRSYDMTRRSRRAAQTAKRIVTAAEELLADGPPGDITLQAIAEGAGVTVQTVLRHFGSRDGCIEAVGERVRERIDEQRGGASPGDIDSALSELLNHYELEGRLVLNLIAHEEKESMIGKAVEKGRNYHRQWVERCFGPLLSAPTQQTIDALVAATDIYLWKLLRIDLGRSQKATRAVIERLVQAGLEEK